MITKRIFFLLFVLLSARITYSQDALQTQYNKAAALYEAGEYFDAITEFKRLLFFDSEKKYSYLANEYIGDSYKMGGKFSDAIIYYTYSEIAAVTDSEIFNARVNCIRANILRRTTTRALAMLDTLSADNRFKKKIQIINYWKGWAYIFSNEWEKAAAAFAETDSNSELVSLCKKVDDEKYSVTLANTLSHFIPGAGQFYTGNYWSGLLSLGWNVLWGYLSVKAFVDNRIFDGIVISNFLWFRFYRGNFENASKFAEEKNTVITNKALNYLQFNYAGLKP